MHRYTGVDGVEHANMAVARANYRDGLVSGLSKAVKEEQNERVRNAKEQDRLRQLELQAKREAKLAKARAEQDVIDAAAAAAGIDPSEIRRVADATFSDDEGASADDADGDRLWQAKSESQTVKSERSESHALTVLHVKCEEVAQEVRTPQLMCCMCRLCIQTEFRLSYARNVAGSQEGEDQARQRPAVEGHNVLRQGLVQAGAAPRAPSLAPH
jgi:hypothetical protein